MTTWLKNMNFVFRGQIIDNALTFLFQNVESVFWACGLFGTVLFFLKVMTLVVAGVGDDILHDAAINSDFDLVEHAAGSALKVISLGSLTGFFMMFGWVGLACLKQYGLSVQASILIGSGAGVMLMVASAVLFRAMLSLASGGSQFSVQQTLGHVGSVYQAIPKGGIGKVQLSIDGLTREVLARSYDGEPIPSFTEVMVVACADSRTIVVKQL